ncbi:MAG: hypothetical protein Q8N81_05590 [bacterium]|nr:hypothetical protein [bacterium]
MPNLYLLVLTTLRNQTLEAMYPLEATQDAVKENRLRFELGESTQPEYASANASLLEKLRIAQRVREMVENWRANVFGGRLL